MSDIYTGVFFRREKTYTEFQAELQERENKGQSIDPKDLSRWHPLGETMMTEIPAVGEIVFINGERMQVLDRAWSLRLPALPGQPNFDDPQCMVTLSQSIESKSQVKEDFFQ